MSLNNVINDNGVLTATVDSANCVSSVITQEDGETDFESVREPRVQYLLRNIVDDSNSTTDTAVLTASIEEGDTIYIKNSLGDIVKSVATGVDTTGASLIPRDVDNGSTGYLVTVSGESSSCLDCMLNPDVSNYWEIRDDSEGLIYVDMEITSGEPIKLYRYRKYASEGDSWDIQGSFNGTDWVTISSEHYQGNYGIYNFNIQSPGEFTHYRVLFNTTNNYYDLRYFNYLKDDGSSINTTEHTNGEIPTQVFKFEEKLKINGTEAIVKDTFKEYGSHGNMLYVFPIYYDVSVTGREITTEIDFSAAGNKVLEVSGKIYKLV